MSATANNSTNNATTNSQPQTVSELLGNGPAVLNLSPKNYVKGYTKDNKGLVIIVDSGCSKTMISKSAVQSSPHLSQLPRQSIEPIHFKIGNGEFLVANETVTFEVTIQNHKLKLNAVISPNLTGPDILLGANSLTEMHGTLDCTAHTLTVRPKRVQFYPSQTFTLKPGQTRTVVVKGKMPKLLKHSEVVLQSHDRLSKFGPSQMLVKLRKSAAPITVSNTSAHPVTFKEHTPVVFTDLKDHVHATQPVPNDILRDDVTREQCKSDLHYQNLLKYPHLDLNDSIAEKSPQQIIQEYISLKHSCLNEAEKQEVYSILLKHKDAFSLYGELGNCPHFEVDIQLTDTSPFFIRPYPIAEEQKKIIDRELNKLVKLGILQKGVNSAYSSPVMLVSKKGSHEKRVVSDFRYLNSRQKQVNQNYVRLQDVLAKLGRSDCDTLSVIDLKSAFHSLRLSAKSVAFTGISPYAGSPNYVYNRLPQGMNISPGVFQEKCQQILREIPNSDSFCVNIHDDILVFSKKTEHAACLESIFQALEKYGLKLSTSKSRFYQKKVTFIGHIISINSEGMVQVEAQNDKTAAIRKMKSPTNAREVKRFIGAVNFLSSYLPRLQEVLTPLHNLTRRNVPFHWGPEQEDAFQKIKQMLIKPPVLCAPVAEGEFSLYCDTSRTATGSYLTQKIKGEERVLAYYSKRLPRACLSYSVSELELFGLYISCTAFRHILQCRSFLAYVDHSSLVQIVKSKQKPPSLRLQKLLERLSQYSFKLAYLKSSQLVLSDFLSRLPHDDEAEWDRIMPIAFPCQEWHDPELCLPATFDRPVTRSYARRMQIPIPTLFPEGRQNRQPQPAENAAPDPPVPNGPPPAVIPDGDNGNVEPPPPPAEPVVDQQIDRRPVPRPRNNRPVFPAPVASMPRPRVQQPDPPPQPQQPEPRLVDKALAKPQTEEHIRDPPLEYLMKPEPLVRDPNKLVAKHIPNQGELNRVLKVIKRKMIRDYNLPYEARQFRLAQQADPYFKPIFDYLDHNILPSDKKAARSVMLRSEQYVLCDNILFRLFFPHNSDIFIFQLAVPEKFIDPVISRYHDTLTASHQGCVRTYATMRKLFWFPGMYSRIVSYLRSCVTCEQFKSKSDTTRPFHERVPVSYCPFSTLSFDIKNMMRSHSGYAYLLICSCSITRFIVTCPLKTTDAPTIAEALIQRVFTTFGIPEVLVCDQASSFTSELMKLLCETLGISQKFISVQNHGSLHAERQIQSIANLLRVHLSQYGQDWPRFHAVCAMSYNSYSSVYLNGHSPFYLVFLREPRDLSGLDFKPVVGVSASHEQYIEHMKEKFKSVSKMMLDLQKHNQKAQNEKIAQKLSSCPVYQKGQLVMLHKPTSSSLTPNSKKFTASYIGPLVVHSVLDRTHYLLEDLQGRLLREVFSFNRLKPAFMRAQDKQNISNLQQLRQVLKLEDEKVANTANVAQAARDYQITDERGMPVEAPTDIVYLAQSQPVELTSHAENLSHNHSLAVPCPLTDKQQCNLVTALENAPSAQAEYTIVKARFKAGNLQLLLSLPVGTSTFKFWWDPQNDENCPRIVELVLSNRKIPCTGSPGRFVKQLHSL